MSLGSAHNLLLSEARAKASECRRMIEAGLDPITEREDEKAARRLEAGVTFAEAAVRYIQEQAPGWKDRKAAATWEGSLKQHVFSVFGGKAVRTIDTQDVLAALRPIWTEKTETAGRLRGRIERILDYARAQGWREGDNPARWRGHLSATLPPPSKLIKVQHHKALSWKDIGPVMNALSASEGLAAKAVRFCCLTAARSGEVRNAIWSEIDMATRVWTIPDHKMKAGKEHRVPLSDEALAILEEVLPLRNSAADGLVFPGHKNGKPLSDVALSKALHLAAGTKEVTVHGLRSTFRDWTSDTSACPRDVAEMALAHAIENKVEAAYRRSDLLEQRRPLMETWARHCQD